MISIAACCHGAKLCAYAAQDFRSQHYYTLYFIHIFDMVWLAGVMPLKHH